MLIFFFFFTVPEKNLHSLTFFFSSSVTESIKAKRLEMMGERLALSAVVDCR